MPDARTSIKVTTPLAEPQPPLLSPPSPSPLPRPLTTLSPTLSPPRTLSSSTEMLRQTSPTGGKARPPPTSEPIEEEDAASEDSGFDEDDFAESLVSGFV